MTNISLLATLVLVLAPAPPQGSAKKETPRADESLLAIEVIKMEPSRPGPDTPMRLKLRLRNKGRQTVSDLAFQVKLNDQPVAAHSSHVWALAPGKGTEVQLYNILTSEPGRPIPIDGRLLVEVRLTGARWQGSDDKGVLTQSSPVQPLPAPLSVVVTTSKGKGR